MSIEDELSQAIRTNNVVTVKDVLTHKFRLRDSAVDRSTFWRALVTFRAVDFASMIDLYLEQTCQGKHGLNEEFQSSYSGDGNYTPLQLCVWFPNKSLIKVLLAKGANLFVKNSEGFTARDFALMTIVSYGPEMEKYLREQEMLVLRHLKEEEDAKLKEQYRRVMAELEQRVLVPIGDANRCPFLSDPLQEKMASFRSQACEWDADAHPDKKRRFV
jgi:hypothetical protein